MTDNSSNSNITAPSISSRPQASRSGRTTHQRKPSLNIPTNLYPIPEKGGNNMTSPTIPSSSSSIPHPPASPTKRYRTSISSFFNWRIITHRIDSFLNPSGPLLPQDKHGAAFGGTGKKSRFSSIVQSRSVRFLFLFYVIFSVFLSINHLWHWAFAPGTVKLDARFGDQWRPERTYDQGNKLI